MSSPLLKAPPQSPQFPRSGGVQGVPEKPGKARYTLTVETPDAGARAIRRLRALLKVACGISACEPLVYSPSRMEVRFVNERNTCPACSTSRPGEGGGKPRRFARMFLIPGKKKTHAHLHFISHRGTVKGADRALDSQVDRERRSE